VWLKEWPECGAETPIPGALMRIHRVARLQAFVHFPVRHLASWGFVIWTSNAAKIIVIHLAGWQQPGF
jgi:hypothetical protein